MRKIDVKIIKKALEDLAAKACCILPDDAHASLSCAFKNETNDNAKFALETLIKNIEISKSESLPICQDTGMAIVFIDIGQEVYLYGGSLKDAINEGIENSYKSNSFRMSVLDPVTRLNTKTNTPAVIHTRIVPGDKIKIDFMPKGFGSENMSKLYMLTPAEGMDAAFEKIVESVKDAGSNPCPPIVVGVGLGGTAEYAMEIAKRALIREIGTVNPDKELAEFEQKLLDKINSLGIGAQGFGGKTTALAVHVEKFPTHISSLPVAVNIQCNCVRKSGVIL